MHEHPSEGFPLPTSISTESDFQPSSAEGGAGEAGSGAPVRTVLHIGCGPANPKKLHRAFQGPQWRERRVDIDPAVAPDLVASATDLSAIGGAAADAVWSSHSLEHLYPHEVPVALREFRRVLKPGGFVLLTVPDLQAVAALVAQGRLCEPAYLSPAGPISPLDMIFGLGSALAKGNSFMAHRTGFTAASLGSSLSDAGFQRIRVRRGKSFSLWAVGHKPEPEAG